MTERGPEQPQGWSAPYGDGQAQDGPPGAEQQPPRPDGSGSVDWRKPEGGSAPLPPPPAAPDGWGGPPQGYGSPQGYGPPQGYGSPQGYGPPPGYGSPQGYGPPPGWGGPAPGAPRPGVVPLRPLGLGELLDGAVSVVRGYPRPTLGPSFLIALVVTVLSVALLALIPDGLFTETGAQDVSDAQIGGAVVGAFGGVVITALAGIVLSGIITAVVGKAVLGEPFTLGQAWSAVRPLLARLFGLAAVTFLLVAGVLVVGVTVAGVLAAVAGGAGLLLGVPLGIAGFVGAVYLYVRLALAAPVMVLEKAGLRESLRRSGVLVRGSWWRVFGILLLTGLVAVVVSNVLQIPFALLGDGAAALTGQGDISTRGLVLTQIGAGIAQTLTAPFTAGVTALLYIDRRMRAEGLDVSLAAAAASPRR